MVCVSTVQSLPVVLFQMKNKDYCHTTSMYHQYADLFPPLAISCGLCGAFKSTFWQRHGRHEAMRESAFIAASLFVSKN